MIKYYKWLYNNIYWLYFIIAHIRMIYYTIRGNKDKIYEIINEHFKW